MCFVVDSGSQLVCKVNAKVTVDLKELLSILEVANAVRHFAILHDQAKVLDYKALDRFATEDSDLSEFWENLGEHMMGLKQNLADSVIKAR